MVSTRPPASKSSRPFNNPLVTVPKAPITIGIIVTFMFHSFFQFSSKTKVLIIIIIIIIIIPCGVITPALANVYSSELQRQPIPSNLYGPVGWSCQNTPTAALQRGKTLPTTILVAQSVWAGEYIDCISAKG